MQRLPTFYLICANIFYVGNGEIVVTLHPNSHKWFNSLKQNFYGKEIENNQN